MPLSSPSSWVDASKLRCNFINKICILSDLPGRTDQRGSDKICLIFLRSLQTVDLSNNKLTRGKAKRGNRSDPNIDSHWETDMTGVTALSEAIKNSP
jgi:hypothetical protein